MDFDPRWGNAIASIESGGEASPYTSITPNPGGRRALGKYQVMEENLPEWTTAAFGRPMYAPEFLNSPDAQEALFRHRFGGYVQKYGNPQDAAAAWFTGGPLSTGANKSDRFGTTGSSYVDKFNRYLDGPTAIEQAMGIKRGTPAMAYADGDGALSTDNTLGSGVLAGGRPAPQGSFENGLMGAAASLASIANPQQGAVLAGLRKDPAQNEYSFIQTPDGRIVRVNKNGSYQVLPGSFAKDPKDEKVDPSILKSVSDDWGSKYGALHNSAQQAAQYEDMIRSGQLDLSLLAKGKAAWESAFGKSSPQTQAYNAFQAFRTQLANDSLRLNKGVQTEGDAARAREELATTFGQNDPMTVANALHNFVDKTGKVMSDQAQSQLDSYSGNYNDKAPFKSYYDRLAGQRQFYEDYAKKHPGVSATAPIAPGTRPPLSSFNR